MSFMLNNLRGMVVRFLILMELLTISVEICFSKYRCITKNYQWENICLFTIYSILSNWQGAESWHKYQIDKILGLFWQCGIFHFILTHNIAFGTRLLRPVFPICRHILNPKQHFYKPPQIQFHLNLTVLSSVCCY